MLELKDIRIDKFIGVCDRLESQMTVKYMAVTPSLEFSNTGRMGGAQVLLSYARAVKASPC